MKFSGYRYPQNDSPLLAIRARLSFMETQAKIVCSERLYLFLAMLREFSLKMTACHARFYSGPCAGSLGQAPSLKTPLTRSTRITFKGFGRFCKAGTGSTGHSVMHLITPKGIRFHKMIFDILLPYCRSLVLHIFCVVWRGPSLQQTSTTFRRE